MYGLRFYFIFMKDIQKRVTGKRISHIKVSVQIEHVVIQISLLHRFEVCITTEVKQSLS